MRVVIYRSHNRKVLHFKRSNLNNSQLIETTTPSAGHSQREWLYKCEPLRIVHLHHQCQDGHTQSDFSHQNNNDAVCDLCGRTKRHYGNTTKLIKQWSPPVQNMVRL